MRECCPKLLLWCRVFELTSGWVFAVAFNAVSCQILNFRDEDFYDVQNLRFNSMLFPSLYCA